MKKHLLFVPVLLAGLLASCGNQPDPEPKPDPVVHVESITLNTDRIVLTEGKSYSIAATVLPKNATDKTFTWSSTDEEVAKYEAGKICGYKPGEVTITVTTNDLHLTDTCLVTVEADTDIHVETISFETKEVDLYVGAIYSQTPIITPDNATCKDVEWSSSLESVATVDKNGSVTAKSEGSTIITATTEDGGKKATYTVNVSETPVDVKTIAEVKEYIVAHPVTVNDHKCGVNQNVSFTIAGYAVAKFDLIKTKKSFGLDVSYPGKTIIADETKTEEINLAIPFVQPKLSANGTLGGSSFAVSGSSTYSTNNDYYKAFDQSSTTYWRPNTASNSYLITYNPTAINITSFTINNTSSSYYARSVVISGSNDNSTYTNIGTITLSKSTATYNVTNTNHYKYYKFTFTPYSTSRMYIYELTLNGTLQE